MSNENAYDPPPSNVDDNNKKQTPGIILILFTILIILLNAVLSFTIAANQSKEIAYILGSVIGGVLLFPLITVGLFQWGKSFRNARSQTKIFF